jgi:hypothetical protein
MSLGIPQFIPRTPDNFLDWETYAKWGPLQEQQAGHWIKIHAEQPVKEDQLFQTTVWTEDHYEVPAILTVLYVALVFGIKHLMKDRNPFHLKTPLAIWNWILTAFSVMGSIVVGQSLFTEWIFGNGIIWELCTPFNEHSNMWVMLFIYSKVPELLDTIFIVLRKKELIFLHWYHHIVTMWFCWFAWARRLECGGGFALMNLMVHSIMYCYYACSAMDLYWPNWARQSVTTLQLSQMVFGLAILGTAWVNCPFDAPLLLGGIAMYFSYFILFAQLFYQLYFVPKKSGAKPKGE